jgi:phage terminase large subunit-like protein
MDHAESEAWQFALMRLGQWVEVDHASWLGKDGRTWWDRGIRCIHMPGEPLCSDACMQLDHIIPSYVGVDKSATGDYSAVVLIQETMQGEWLTLVEVFKPDISGAIDHAAVRDYLIDLHSKFNIAQIGYDPRYFVEGAQTLRDKGLPMQEVPQTRERLEPVYSAFYQLIRTGQLLHNGDEEYRMHVLSAVSTKSQIADGFMLAKGRSRHKIDAAVATAIALYVADVEPLTEPPDIEIHWNGALAKA